MSPYTAFNAAKNGHASEVFGTYIFKQGFVIGDKGGLTTTVFEEASIGAEMIACARRAIVLADASKFGVGAFAQIAPLAAVDVLVTDALPPLDLRHALSQAKMEMILAPA